MQGPQRAIGVGWQVAVRSRCVRGSSDERVESVSFTHHPVCETGGTQVTVCSLRLWSRQGQQDILCTTGMPTN